MFANLLICSCSKDYYFQRDQIKISKNLKEIIDLDQSVRFYRSGLESRFRLRTFNTVHDSLIYINENYDGSYNYSTIPDISNEISKIPKHLQKSYENQKRTSDILFKCIDSVNQINLFKIIKKYGYPSYENRKWKSDNLRVGVTFVLTHIDSDSKTGKKYFDILMNEYKKGRFDEGSMRHYLWHYSNRQGMIDHKSSIDTLINIAKKKRKQSVN